MAAAIWPVILASSVQTEHGGYSTVHAVQYSHNTTTHGARLSLGAFFTLTASSHVLGLARRFARKEAPHTTAYSSATQYRTAYSNTLQYSSLGIAQR